MLGAQHCSFSILSSLRPLKPSLAPFIFTVYNPIQTLRPARAQKLLPSRQESWLANASPPFHPEEGPIELPSSDSSFFPFSDAPTPIQIAASLLLTGAISVFLFRSLRRRLNRAKELKFRSLGAKQISELDAIESLKEIKLIPTDAKDPPPSPVEALFGGLTAGVIALILYKFTTTIESSLNQQALSDNFSVRQMTITIRTIVNGLFYLATCVFGMNSVGLFLYSCQLVLNLLSVGSTPSQETENKRETQLSSDPVDTSGRNINKDDI